MIWLPSLQDALLLHDKLIERTGGTHGVRDEGLIASALARASTGFGGIEKYPGAVDKAAAIGCGLIQNHGFLDGNKRIGIAMLLLVLRRNGVRLNYSQAELIELGLSVAQDIRDIEAVRQWIEVHEM